MTWLWKSHNFHIDSGEPKQTLAIAVFFYLQYIQTKSSPAAFFILHKFVVMNTKSQVLDF